VSNGTNYEENIERPGLYQDNDIKIGKTYSSNERWSVARVRLEEYRCDGPADEPFVETNLSSTSGFQSLPTREVKFLDKAMWLVDAGDYGNDGNSELVFSIDDYNHGGYKLFYDHFQKKAVFEFGYH